MASVQLASEIFRESVTQFLYLKIEKSVLFIILPIHFQYVGARTKDASDTNLLHNA
jgi:hypothetical protein